MSVRGLVIAVETYPALEEGLAPLLPGTMASTERFREWLVDSKGAASGDISFCTDDPDAPGRTAGASRSAIVAEVNKLQTGGKDATSQLYVYLSGHGFGYSDIDGVRVADLFVCSDFRQRKISGDAVLKIDALQTFLRHCLGPGDHYYFVDCCRNFLTTAEIKAVDLPLVYDHSRLGQPTVYTMYSTQEQTGAAVASGFGESLLLGLKGTGRAKLWRGAEMAVVFHSLKDFVRARMPSQPVDGRTEGDGAGVIVAIAPPPTYRCAIRVADADAGDEFEVKVRNIRGQPVGDPRRFSGPVGGFEEIPDDYKIEVYYAGKPLLPPSRDADLYDACELEFRKAPPPAPPPAPVAGAARGAAARPAAAMPPPAPPPAQPPAGLSVEAPARGRVTVTRLGREEESTEVQPGERGAVTGPGHYEISVKDADGIPFHRESVALEPGAQLHMNFVQLKATGLREALIQVAFDPVASGTTPPAADQGLDLLLALLGAARISGGPNDSIVKRGVPLRPFDDQPPGASPVFVLAGFEEPRGSVMVGVSTAGQPRWTPAEPVPGVPVLFQAFLPTDVPGDLVSVRVDQGPVRTVASCRMANRVTFLTVSHGDAGELRVQQFLLPMYHLISKLPPLVRDRLGPLDPRVMAKRIVRATRQVAARRSLAVVLPGGELEELLYGKWLDPIMGVFAAYELFRRGEPASGGQLREVIRNMRQFFPELPDGAALEHLIGSATGPLPRAPLVLDGFLGLAVADRPAVLPVDRLDYRGPWTSWINAVEPPAPAGG